MLRLAILSIALCIACGQNLEWSPLTIEQNPSTFSAQGFRDLIFTFQLGGLLASDTTTGDIKLKIIGENSLLFEAGKPELPIVRKSIALPDNLRGVEKWSVEVLEVEEADIPMEARIAPSKGNLPRSVNPNR